MLKLTLSAAVAVVAALSSVPTAALAAPVVIADPAKITDGFVYEAIPLASASQLSGAAPGMNQSLGVGVTGSTTVRHISSLIRFDLTGVTLNPATERATLTLRNIGVSFIEPPASSVSDPTVTQPISVGLKRIDSAWSYNTTSYNAGSFSFGGPQQANVGRPAVDATVIDTELVSAVGQAITFDITAQVQAWLASPSTNFGLYIEQTSAPEFISGDGWAVANFASSRVSGGVGGPAFAITAIPEPASLAILASVGTLILRRR
jgi:hypothetical protein